MSLSDFMVQSATVQTEVVTKDRLGGANRTSDWSTIVNNVPCLVRPLGAALENRDDARRDVAAYRIYFESDPSPTGIGTRNRIKVGTATYQVTGVVDANSLGSIFHVDCELIKNA